MRVLASSVVTWVVLALGATAASAATAPRIHPPRAAHLIGPAGAQHLAVAVPVTARGSVRTTRVTLTATVRLPDGRRVRATSTRRDHPLAHRRLEHQLHFSPAETRLIRAAPRPTLVVRATATADTDGDGTPEDPTPPASISTPLPPTTPPEPAPGATSAHARGTDPCGIYYPGANGCQNTAGDPWNADFFWDHNAIVITCPWNFPWASGKSTVDTASGSYTQTTGALRASTSVYITDDNVRGHPWSYTAYTACIITEPDWETAGD